MGVAVSISRERGSHGKCARCNIGATQTCRIHSATDRRDRSLSKRISQPFRNCSPDVDALQTARTTPERCDSLHCTCSLFKRICSLRWRRHAKSLIVPNSQRVSTTVKPVVLKHNANVAVVRSVDSLSRRPRERGGCKLET